ncbi:hypothetical protein [Pseudomonas sp. B14(2022)]|uniref:hypothetical protein n=1 Tax=Pseudomonas sp. B14(2022) TaxID=2914043 RepID=UPI001F3445BF|nr:hypothetical protein [Pseudomonas sp. B14(2022)]
MLRESEQSRTRSAVSEGTIIVRNPLGASDLVGLNRDTANANEQLDRPDEKALQERMDLIQSSAKLGQSIVQTVVTAKQAEAEAQSESVRNNPDSTPEQQARAARAVEDANSWAIGGNKRLMADIATGLVAAGLGGAGGTTGVGILANTTAAHTYKAIGDYADQREFEATDSLVKKAWGEGGAARILLHTLAGATQGLSSGNALAGAQGAAASATFMPMVDKALKDSGVKESERNSLATLISAGVGAVAASGGNVGGQVTAANTGNAVDAYNRQLHPKEIPLLISEAPALALAAGISVEEAQARLGRALAYYTDAGWQSLLGSKGLPPDDLTLTHLGQALAPLGNMYDPGPTSDVPTLTPTIKNYTPEETLRLVQNYQFTHAAAFADKTINLDYLTPIARFDSDQTEALDFYNRNLNFAEGANTGQPYGPVSYTSPEGTFKGQREALVGTAEGIFTLGKNLLTHPVDTSEQIAFGLINTASHPVDLVGGLWAEGQTAYGLGKLYELQGDPVNSAAVIEKYKTEWALAFLPINRAEKAAKLGGMVKTSEELGATERVLDKVDGGSPGRLVVDEPNFKLEGGSQFLESLVIQPNTTAKLSGDVTLTSGTVGAKGPGQVIPDAISPPKFSRVEDLFGQTFESIPLSHLPNWKTGSLANDGVLGEQLSLQTLNEKTGLNFKPLQNSSNHGCDGCAVAINGDTITVVVMDAKSSVNGVNAARTPHGDPETRLRGWLQKSSITQSDPALAEALVSALGSDGVKVQGVTVKIGLPAPGKTGQAEIKVEPWPKK